MNIETTIAGVPDLLDQATEPLRVFLVGRTRDRAREILFAELAPRLNVVETIHTNGREALKLADGTLIRIATSGEGMRGISASLILVDDEVRDLDSTLRHAALATQTSAGVIAILTADAAAKAGAGR